jgi:hypothetical protein
MGNILRFFCRHPRIEFGKMPSSVRFAKNVTHFLALHRMGSFGKNFGHDVFEKIASVYHAMESFDLLPEGGRQVHFQNLSLSDYLPNYVKCSRSGAFYLFPHVAAFIEEYPSGTCFHKMVVGHAGVGSLWSSEVSLHRAAHILRFRNFYLDLLQLRHVVTKSHPKSKIIFNFYPKVVVGNQEVWSDVCKLSRLLENSFSNVEFRCISLQSMSVELQVIILIHYLLVQLPTTERCVLYHSLSTFFVVAHLRITDSAHCCSCCTRLA